MRIFEAIWYSRNKFFLFIGSFCCKGDEWDYLWFVRIFIIFSGKASSQVQGEEPEPGGGGERGRWQADHAHIWGSNTRHTSSGKRGHISFYVCSLLIVSDQQPLSMSSLMRKRLKGFKSLLMGKKTRKCKNYVRALLSLSPLILVLQRKQLFCDQFRLDVRIQKVLVSTDMLFRRLFIASSPKLYFLETLICKWHG